MPEAGTAQVRCQFSRESGDFRVAVKEGTAPVYHYGTDQWASGVRRYQSSGSIATISNPTSPIYLLAYSTTEVENAEIDCRVNLDAAQQIQDEDDAYSLELDEEDKNFDLLAGEPELWKLGVPGATNWIECRVTDIDSGNIDLYMRIGDIPPVLGEPNYSDGFYDSRPSTRCRANTDDGLLCRFDFPRGSPEDMEVSVARYTNA